MDLFTILTCLFCYFPLVIETRSSRKARQVDILDSFCVTRLDGKIFPDPADCNSYILCSVGYAYRSTCAPGLYYNHMLQTCDYDNGHCAGPMSGIIGVAAPGPDGAPGGDVPALRRTPGANLGRRVTDIIPHQPVNNNNINYVGTFASLSSYCRNQHDGTYSHPYDCHSYILCSNQVSFSTTCPDNLIYNPSTGGCDFDIEGLCQLAKTKADLGSFSIDRPSSSINLNSLNKKISENEMPDALADMMPSAIENAMTALTEKLQHESELSKLLTGTEEYENNNKRQDRPFRFVQKFLQAQPLTKQLSLPAFILNQATDFLRDSLGLEPNQETMAILASLSSPLPPSTYRISSDDPFPQPEPGTCPWPMYNCVLSKYRSYDGSCNNLFRPLLGRAFTPLERFLTPDYGDGMQTFRQSRLGGALPGARLVSFTVNEDQNIPHQMNTLMLMQWGQFLDHDLSHTAVTKISTDPSGYGTTEDIECGMDGCEMTHEACSPILIPPGDPAFTGKACLQFVRSQDVPNINCTMGPREQINQISSYLDASNVYGSSVKEAKDIRDTSDPNRGRMLMTVHPFSNVHKSLLPRTNDDKECKEFDEEMQCFKAGDGRVNEQSMLTVMHTLWVREHNRIEEQLNRINPQWNGDTLYHETRRIIGAMMQHITYSEFLPVVLGPLQLQTLGLELKKDGYFEGYDSTVNPGVANVFATAAFRFGHSLIPDQFKRVNQNYEDKFPSLPLSQLFFRPRQLYNTKEGGMDSLIQGLCDQNIQNVDRFVTQEVTQKLFSDEPPHGFGTDLVSLNIQRGRDHGIPGYTAWRKWCGFGEATRFEDLTDISDPSVRDKFKSVYRHVDDIDLFPALLAEDRSPGGLTGPTPSCILGRQFSNLRKGDRFWYENSGAFSFTEDQLSEIRKVSLAKVICNNGDNITQIQTNVMELPFREAYPTREYSEDAVRKNGLNLEWFNRLWTSDYNSRVGCDCLGDIDFAKWKAT